MYHGQQLSVQKIILNILSKINFARDYKVGFSKTCKGKVSAEKYPAFEGTPDLEFFKVLGIPRRGDWLAEHKEVGQRYTTYQRRMKPPLTPSARVKHTVA